MHDLFAANFVSHVELYMVFWAQSQQNTKYIQVWCSNKYNNMCCSSCSSSRKMRIRYCSVIPLLGIYPKGTKTLIGKDICTFMFIQLFIVVKTLICHEWTLILEEIVMLWYMFSMEYDFVIKKDKIVPFDIKWMNLEVIMLNEIRKWKTITRWFHSYVEYEYN